MDAMTDEAGHTADREIVITRLIAAPPELVFDAWTDPKQIGRWWGPNGFTTTTHSMDVTPGGVWRFVMHGPDGRDYQNKIVYREVKRPERLVYAHAGDEAVEPVSFHTTVTLARLGAKTKVTMRAVFPSAAERDRVVRDYGAVEGGEQTLARLDRHLAATAEASGAEDPGEPQFVITRIFDAPRERVWKAWTEPERLAQWWGPKGSKIRVVTLELRPGGLFH
jgi:uncharacterized protein YndB with AHSA1/START domain